MNTIQAKELTRLISNPFGHQLQKSLRNILYSF